MWRGGAWGRSACGGGDCATGVQPSSARCRQAAVGRGRRAAASQGAARAARGGRAAPASRCASPPMSTSACGATDCGDKGSAALPACGAAYISIGRRAGAPARGCRAPGAPLTPAPLPAAPTVPPPWAVCGYRCHSRPVDLAISMWRIRIGCTRNDLTVVCGLPRACRACRGRRAPSAQDSPRLLTCCWPPPSCCPGSAGCACCGSQAPAVVAVPLPAPCIRWPSCTQRPTPRSLACAVGCRARSQRAAWARGARGGRWDRCGGGGGGSGAGARPGGATKGWVKGREERTRLKVRGGVSAVVPICGKRPDGARASVVAAPAAPQRHAWGAAGHSWKAECSVSGARDRGQRLAGPAAASCQCHEGGGGPTARPQRRAGWAM